MEYFHKVVSLGPKSKKNGSSDPREEIELQNCNIRRVQFPQIPRHLQTNIAEKLEYTEFARFVESSKLASQVGNGVRTKVSLDIKYLDIYKEAIEIITENRKSFYWDPKTQSIPNFVRFCVRKEVAIKYPIFGISWNFGFNALNYVLDCGHFIELNLRLHVSDTLSEVSPEKFTKLVDIFDVNWFSTSNFYEPIKEDLLKTQKFRELKRIELYSPIKDEDFLELRAPLIRYSPIYNSSRLSETTLNLFFKQWLNNEREIHIFTWKFAPTVLDAKTVFHELPVTVLWTMDTHNKSCISNVSPKSLHSKDGEHYVIKRGEEKLWIRINRTNNRTEHHIVVAELVKDEEMRLRLDMEKNLYNKMRNRDDCFYNHEENYCPVHGQNDYCECCFCPVQRNGYCV